MAKIHDYPLKAVPAAGDKLVISNAADGNNTYSVDVSTLGGGGGGGAFDEVANVVQQTVAGASYGEDFVFGSPQLDDDAVAAHQSRFFFDESKSAFRAGLDNGGWFDDAGNRGSYSVGFGYNTVARGDYSFAHGYQAFAIGAGSVAIGSTTTVTFDRTYAYGGESFALGRMVKSVGDQSMAVGDECEAISNQSICMGSRSVAAGRFGVSLGSSLRGTGYGATVFGSSNTVGPAIRAATIAGAVVTIVGDVTSDFANGDEVAFWGCDSGPNYVASFTDTINTVVFGGVNTTFNLDSGATAATPATCAVIDNATFGRYSLAAGQTNSVYGGWSACFGLANSVDGNYAFAAGQGTDAGSDYAVAMGSGTTATGDGSVCFGVDGTANGNYSFATGDTCFVDGVCSGAIGANCQVFGDYSFGIGANTSVAAAADYSMAMGVRSEAQMLSSFAQASGRFTSEGDAQYQRVVVFEDTTDATSTVLLLEGPGGSSIPVAANKSYMFNIDVMASQTNVGGGGAIGDSWSYNIKGTIQNLAGTTQMLGTPSVTTIYEMDTNFSVNVVANNGADTMDITVTGVASKTVRWVATVNFTEVQFA